MNWPPRVETQLPLIFLNVSLRATVWCLHVENIIKGQLFVAKISITQAGTKSYRFKTL